MILPLLFSIYRETVERYIWLEKTTKFIFITINSVSSNNHRNLKFYQKQKKTYNNGPTFLYTSLWNKNNSDYINFVNL
jgi:hypothetical protein